MTLFPFSRRPYAFRAAPCDHGPALACQCGSTYPVIFTTGDENGLPTGAMSAQASVPAISRRHFLGAATGSAALAGLAGLFAPHAAMADTAPSGVVEKPDLNIGFVPISCSAPLIMATAKGFFQSEGLNVQLRKAAGWALIRDKLLDGSLDASHLLSPMPLALSLGLGGNAAQPIRVATMQNINGQAITLALKHWHKRDPRDWKGMTFAIPFQFSMHNLLLRNYLALHGLDPDKDVSLRVTAPPDMVANLKAGNIDGFLGPEPFNQRAVYEEAGFLHVLSADLWDGHPCCAFGTTASFAEKYPNTYRALQRAMIRAAYFMQEPSNRLEAAHIMAQAAYLNQPEIVIEQSLTGHYADGLGVVRDNPRRSGFSPYPYPSMAVWILSQFSRWGYLKENIPLQETAQRIFMIDEVRKQAAAVALPAPEDGQNNWPVLTVMGQRFDAFHPPSYSKG